jgi:hypothetical protein
LTELKSSVAELDRSTAALDDCELSEKS